MNPLGGPVASTLIKGLEVAAPNLSASTTVLTGEALQFLADLHRTFEAQRQELLAERIRRQAKLDRGDKPGFRADTAAIREGSWRVPEAPPDLRDRRVEITGPVERKMMINALNSGAQAFMADFEDSHAPTWANNLDGHVNLQDAVRRTLSLDIPGGKSYRLDKRTATLLVRPRGWHLPERHVLVDGRPMSGSLFDFGLHAFHNAKELRSQGTGVYLYLPKMEAAEEARLWHDVFEWTEQRVGVPQGTVRSTVLIETILAAFEMEEILHALGPYATALNAGRWDYIFSIIKKFRNHGDMVMPDRAQVTMGVPFMRHYADLLVQTCHRRGAHAMGGMAAFIPNRRDPVVTETALAKVREDKQRESLAGFDGTWVAHPDLVPLALGVFQQNLNGRPNQLGHPGPRRTITPADLLKVDVPGASVTPEGVRNNVEVCLRYVGAWLGGQGAVAIHNLMEDAATAEIARSQVWQWIRHASSLSDGTQVTRKWVSTILDEEAARLGPDATGPGPELVAQAKQVFQTVALGREFVEFLTLPAYERLDGTKEGAVS